jgi:hypothetical protein
MDKLSELIQAAAAEAFDKGYALGVNTSRPPTAELVHDAEADGYARGVEAGKKRIKETVPALLEAAEDQGYARGVKDAAQVAESRAREWAIARMEHAAAARCLSYEIRDLLKPKGEAK